MSDCRFNAIKNGRRLAARRLGPVVLCPIFSCASGLSASRLFSRSHGRRRSWLLTWQGRRGGQAIERRGSFIHRVDGFNKVGDRFAQGHVPGFVVVRPRADGRASFLADNGAEGGTQGGVGHVAQLCAEFLGGESAGFGFDGRCHFAFSFRPGVGLVLFSETRIPNRLAIVNGKKK